MLASSVARKSGPGSILLCAVAGLGIALPFWLVRYPPLQDLPVHMATLQVVHALHDASSGFAAYYETNLATTPYAAFYVAGDLLAFLIGVQRAALALITLYIVGMPLALRALLNALGADWRLSLLVLPILPNCLLLMGFFNFLLGIPLALYAISIAIRLHEKPTLARGAWFAVLTIVLFYTHIISLGFCLLACAITFPWRRVRRWPACVPAYLPAAALLANWAFGTASGKWLTNTFADVRADVWPFDASLRYFYDSTFDLFPNGSDERFFVALLAATLIVTVAGRKTRRSGLKWRWALLPIACLVLYFRSEGNHGYAAYIRDRFPLLAIVSAIPLLRFPAGIKGHVATVGLLVLGAFVCESTLWHFRRFEDTEVGEFELALAQIPPDKKVLGLTFESTSQIVNRSPYLHFANYYQVQKGGLVIFGFAGYPHWPTAFLPHAGPPPTSPRRKAWEWEPWYVTEEEDMLFYDYALVRAASPRTPPPSFDVVFQGPRWGVWKHAIR